MSNNKELKFIEKHKNCTDKDKIIYKYGLEALYNLDSSNILTYEESYSIEINPSFFAIASIKMQIPMDTSPHSKIVNLSTLFFECDLFFHSLDSVRQVMISAGGT